MGGIPSSPLDESTKQEMQELIKKVLGTFTTQYLKEYALALVLKIKMEANEKPESWQLLERPPWSEDFKSGVLLKEGGIRKSWKKRYFTVRPNYVVDYFESEAEAKKEKGKKKGSISLCGYRVIDDVNNGVLQRLTKLAEKMGMNVSDLPKPKEYPPFTLELHHDRRRCYFIQAENEKEFKEWVEQFKDCCRRAYGLKNQEFVHKTAFDNAIRKTRWELGRWGWYSWGGSEEQVLSDLISDELDWQIMGRVYGKISGPWAIRNTIRNQVLKFIDTLVSAAVTPAWGAMEKAVEELRPKIEPTIKEMVGPIFKAEADLMEKMKQGAMSIIDPILKEHVTPHLSKIVAVLKSPMTEAYDESFKMFDEEISKFEVKGGVDVVKKEFYHLDWFARSWKMWPALSKVDVMYEPLWALHVIFEDIYPWSSIWKAYDDLRGKMDNAIYTFEQRLVQGMEAEGEVKDGKALVDTTKTAVLADYKADAQKATLIYYAAVLKIVVMPPFEKLVIPACKTVIDPISDLVPEPLKQFIDPSQMFEDLLNGIIDGCIDTILSSDTDNQQQ
jgi:hypothetical protein